MVKAQDPPVGRVVFESGVSRRLPWSYDVAGHRSSGWVCGGSRGRMLRRPVGSRHVSKLTHLRKRFTLSVDGKARD